MAEWTRGARHISKRIRVASPRACYVIPSAQFPFNMLRQTANDSHDNRCLSRPNIPRNPLNGMYSTNRHIPNLVYKRMSCK